MQIANYQLDYILQHIEFAAGDSPGNRPHSILFECANQLTAVATDGHQLAICELNITAGSEEQLSFTIPALTLNFVSKYIKQNSRLAAQLHVTQTTVIIRLPQLAIDFPNHAQLFPAWRTLLENLNFDASPRHEMLMRYLYELIEHSQEHVLLPHAEMFYSQKMLQRAFRAWNKKRYLYKTVHFAYSATKHPSVRFIVQDERPGVRAQWTYVLAPILMKEAT
jgi:hypothetical protein